MATSGGPKFITDPSVGDDTVEYFLFPKLEVSSKSELSEALERFREQCLCILQEYIEQYIWQNEQFVLQVPHEYCYGTSASVEESAISRVERDQEILPPHLWGRTCYSECVEDEWFIVFLLRHLTRNVSGLVVRVADADGEFLLIEAADHIPDAYDPETSHKRVYLFAGDVHLLPLSLPDNQLTVDGTPVTMAAVESVRDSSAATRATDEVQTAIDQKTDGYPGKITSSHHRALVRIPAAAAALLQMAPQLLPAAVQGFYLRDPIDLRACRAMRFFPPETCVKTCITFTKTLYAQLVHQQFKPDPKTGWQLPPPNREDFRAADVGMKLACGLEILAARGNTTATGDGFPCEPSLEELKGDVRWQRYVSSLNGRQYFGDLLEGSEQHKALLEKARQFYITHMLSEPRSSTPADVVHKLLKSIKVDHAQWKRREAELPQPDDDSWLELDSNQLEDVLRAQFQLQNQAPDELGSELKDFLSKLSGVEGVEAQGKSAGGSRKTSRARKTSRKLSSNAALRKISSQSAASTTSECSTLSQKIDFNADHFTETVRGMLDLNVEEEEWSDDSSGMSSYGDEDESPALDELMDEGRTVTKLMEQMDEELQDTTLAESFIRATNVTRKESGASDSSGAGFEDVETFRPVDVDMNMVQNLLQSIQGQTGAEGPAQSLLKSLSKRGDEE